MGAIINYLFTNDCSYACGHEIPYGFVPECGCPVHDPETLLYAIASYCVLWLRRLE